MLTSRPTHGGGAPFGIDLDAGIAKITVRRPASPPEAATEEPAPAEGQPPAAASGPDPAGEADEVQA